LTLPGAFPLELTRHYSSSNKRKGTLMQGWSIGHGGKLLRRYVSADGKRAFRMGVNDILGKHGGDPHVNFETLIPNTAKPGKMIVDRNIHIYLTD
jgi:hypothetical protein